jgi:hypothetical protein
MYADMLQRYFQRMSESERQYRIRSYDNSQRFTLGRAMSPLLDSYGLAERFSITRLERLGNDRSDMSFFPGGLDDALYAPLGEVLSYALDAILGADDFREKVMVSLLCHRVLLRPQERYKGFLHRDLAPRGGRIGTAIWYPEVRDSLVEGMEFIAFAASQAVPLGALRSKEPDLKATPATYRQKVMILPYPHNYAHGVLPGANPKAVVDRVATLDDFIAPPPDCFIKDLVIIGVSVDSPIEE